MGRMRGMRRVPSSGFCGRRVYAMDGAGLKNQKFKRSLIVGTRRLLRGILPILKKVGQDLLPVAGQVAGKVIEDKTGSKLAGDLAREGSKVASTAVSSSKGGKELSPAQVAAADFIASRSKAKLSSLGGSGGRLIGGGGRLIGSGGRLIGSGNRLIGSGGRLIGSGNRLIGGEFANIDTGRIVGDIES